MEECKARFGFANGAWDSAISRGDIVPREDRTPPRPSRTRRAVKALLEEGLTQAAIARKLGVSKATVCHHVRRLGIPSSQACLRRYDWAEVQRYYDAGHSKRQCQDHLGFTSKSWYDAVLRGAVVPRPAAAPIETYLVAGRKVSRGHLKRRLIADGLKENRCEDCGIDTWRGRPLSMALHHINGDGNDNRLENLQLLCGNCHSQTPNFSGRNKYPARARCRTALEAVGGVKLADLPRRRLPVRGTVT
jgi:hypothetical protein